MDYPSLVHITTLDNTSGPSLLVEILSVLVTQAALPPTPPDFVGEHYYCDLAMPNYDPSDPIWDKTSCPTTDNCGPPWFHRTLSTSTRLPLKVRRCTDEEGAPDERVGVKLFELYVR